MGKKNLWSCSCTFSLNKHIERHLLSYTGLMGFSDYIVMNSLICTNMYSHTFMFLPLVIKRTLNVPGLAVREASLSLKPVRSQWPQVVFSIEDSS